MTNILSVERDPGCANRCDDSAERARRIWNYANEVARMLEGERRSCCGGSTRGIRLHRRGMMRVFSSAEDAAEFLGVNDSMICHLAAADGTCRGWVVKYAAGRNRANNST